MADIIDAGGFGDILEASSSVIFKEDVAAADRGHKQVLVAVVIDIRERCGDADLVCERDACLSL